MHRPQADFTFIRRSMAKLSSMVKNGVDALASSRALRDLESIFRRMVRQQERETIRRAKHSAYYRVGLNGKRSVERRRRQIADGSLRAENGLTQ